MNHQDVKNGKVLNNNQPKKSQESFEEAPLWAAIVTITFTLKSVFYNFKTKQKKTRDVFLFKKF